MNTRSNGNSGRFDGLVVNELVKKGSNKYPFDSLTDAWAVAVGNTNGRERVGNVAATDGPPRTQ